MTPTVKYCRKRKLIFPSQSLQQIQECRDDAKFRDKKSKIAFSRDFTNNNLHKCNLHNVSIRNTTKPVERITDIMQIT